MARDLKLVVDGEAAARFPEVQVAAFLAHGLRPGSLAAVGDALIAEAREMLRRSFATPADVVADPRIAGWRDAIRLCGLSASDVRSSAEQLARRLLTSENGVAADAPVVRAYCAVSAKHLAPVGAYDADRLPTGAVALRPARPGDAFAPLGGMRADPVLTRDVIVYAADGEVLCWAFNHRDSARTALRPETERALFVAESAFASQRSAMLAALDELRRVLVADGVAVGELALASAGSPRAAVAAP